MNFFSDENLVEKIFFFDFDVFQSHFDGEKLIQKVPSDICWMENMTSEKYPYFTSIASDSPVPSYSY